MKHPTMNQFSNQMKLILWDLYHSVIIFSTSCARIQIQNILHKGNTNQNMKWFLQWYDYLNRSLSKKYSDGKMELQTFIDFKYQYFIVLATIIQMNERGLTCDDIFDINLHAEETESSCDSSFEEDEYEQSAGHHASNSKMNNVNNVQSLNLLDGLKDKLLNEMLKNIMLDADLIKKIILKEELIDEIYSFLNYVRDETVKGHKINQEKVGRIFRIIYNFLCPES
jgi:hypothetical protein